MYSKNIHEPSSPFVEPVPWYYRKINALLLSMLFVDAVNAVDRLIAIVPMKTELILNEEGGD